jgi:hypothetical protein
MSKMTYATGLFLLALQAGCTLDGVIGGMRSQPPTGSTRSNKRTTEEKLSTIQPEKVVAWSPIWPDATGVWCHKASRWFLVESKKNDLNGNLIPCYFVLDMDRALDFEPKSCMVSERGIEFYDEKKEKDFFLAVNESFIEINGPFVKQLKDQASELAFKPSTSSTQQNTDTTPSSLTAVLNYVRKGNGQNQPLDVKGTLQVPKGETVQQVSFVFTKEEIDLGALVETVFQKLHSHSPIEQPVQTRDCLICPSGIEKSMQTDAYELQTTLKDWSGNVDLFPETYCLVQLNKRYHLLWVEKKRYLAVQSHAVSTSYVPGPVGKTGGSSETLHLQQKNAQIVGATTDIPVKMSSTASQTDDQTDKINPDSNGEYTGPEEEEEEEAFEWDDLSECPFYFTSTAITKKADRFINDTTQNLDDLLQEDSIQWSDLDFTDNEDSEVSTQGSYDSADNSDSEEKNIMSDKIRALLATSGLATSGKVDEHCYHSALGLVFQI